MTSKLPTRGSGFISSLEAGYPLPLALGPDFTLEPQGQILYQWVGIKAANDGLQTIGLGTTSGVTGRLGLRAQWTIDGANGAVWQPYGRANIWRDWGADAATSFAGSSITVPLVEQATRLEFAGGVTVRVGPQLGFYAQAGYQFAVAPTVPRDGFKGNIGLRYTW